jgi:hypothetical protein
MISLDHAGGNGWSRPATRSATRGHGAQHEFKLDAGHSADRVTQLVLVVVPGYLGGVIQNSGPSSSETPLRVTWA